MRLRDGGPLMHPDSISMAEDITMCCKNSALIQPLLTRMSMLKTRPLPAIEQLRDQVEDVFTRNKRGTKDLEGSEIVRLAWHIRKLCGFVKMKVRRKEVSMVSWLIAIESMCAQHWIWLRISCLEASNPCHPRFKSFRSCAWSWMEICRPEVNNSSGLQLGGTKKGLQLDGLLLTRTGTDSHATVYAGRCGRGQQEAQGFEKLTEGPTVQP